MFPEMFKMLRLRKGMSQQAIGEMCGVSAVAVGKWERGQTQPDIETLMLLADLFDVTLDELCDRSPLQKEEVSQITAMARAFSRMTDDEQEKYLAVGRALFSHAFEDKK